MKKKQEINDHLRVSRDNLDYLKEMKVKEEKRFPGTRFSLNDMLDKVLDDYDSMNDKT